MKLVGEPRGMMTALGIVNRYVQDQFGTAGYSDALAVLNCCNCARFHGLVHGLSGHFTSSKWVAKGPRMLKEGANEDWSTVKSFDRGGNPVHCNTGGRRRE